MHLSFPDRSDRFNRDELRCLVAALGFRNDVFSKHIPLGNKSRSYVETKVLLQLVERKAFNHDLHETHNLHDGVYNVKVLEKSLLFLSKRLITFSELKIIRIAFEVYECPDLSGMEICPHIILRTLKMCGRVISPRKLMDHVKHMDRDVPDRLTLYEFMEIVPLCERISDVKHRLEEKAEVKRRRRSNVSELADFHEILVQEEKKQTNFLDDDYEKNFFRPTFEDKPTWRVPPENVINNEDWMKHVLGYRQVADGLDVSIGQTNRKVVRARTGTPGQRTTFRHVNHSFSVSGQSGISEALPQTFRPKVKEFQAHDKMNDMTGSEANVKPLLSTSEHAQPMPRKTRQYCWSEEHGQVPQRSKLSKDNTLVTNKALKETHTKIVNLLWDLEMKDTILKIRSKDEDPKSNPKISVQEKRQSSDRGRPRLQETAQKSPQKYAQKATTIPQRRSPTSTMEIYEFLNERSKRRDRLLSRARSFNTSRDSLVKQGRQSRT